MRCLRERLLTTHTTPPPPTHTPAQTGRDAFVNDLNRFPVVIETPRMIMRKAELDKKIAQLEASIESFSKCTVLVDKQDYEVNFAWMEEEGEGEGGDDASSSSAPSVTS